MPTLLLALVVHVQNAAALPQRSVEEALMIASGVYRRAGVTVQWLPAMNSGPSNTVLTIVIVASAEQARFAAAEDSLGVARNLDGTRGTVAYVFDDRVRAFAERGHIDAWMVLGCAIAHELGHLLLPVNSHAADGIMRARWDPNVISRTGGFLNFLPDQARLLRLRVASRSAPADAPHQE